jgi:hypothetical protein
MGLVSWVQLFELAGSGLRWNETTPCRNPRIGSEQVAQRELRLFGKYRVLFDVDERARQVIIVLVGEKRGESLFVRGGEFTAHHESNPAE